jgi:hypothetical protein
MEVVEQRAIELGATELMGYARAEVLRWIESMGWRVWGPGPKLMGQVDHLTVGKDLRGRTADT